MPKVGDKVERYPITFTGDYDKPGKKKRKITGTVVYVHPQGRYHIVEFAVSGGAIREGFIGVTNKEGSE